MKFPTLAITNGAVVIPPIGVQRIVRRFVCGMRGHKPNPPYMREAEDCDLLEPGPNGLHEKVYLRLRITECGRCGHRVNLEPCGLVVRAKNKHIPTCSEAELIELLGCKI
jgi:hypothetical protein